MKVCILSFNHPEITARAVVSALSFFADKDIFLIHNGSRRENIHALQEQFPRIQHLEILFNKGFTAGANFGLKEVFQKTDWVLFLTNDCELLSVPETKDYSSKQIVVPYIYFKKGERLDSVGATVDLKQAKLWHCKSPSEFKEDTGKGVFQYAPGASFLLHRSAFATIGGFDETLHTYWEDVDFSLRAKSLGFEFALEPTFRVHHGGGKTCKKDSFYTNYLYQRNRRIVCRRWNKKMLGESFSPLQLEILLLKDFFSTSFRMLLRGRFKDLNVYFQAVLESYF